jgi:large subunit ribosomal protein L29
MKIKEIRKFNNAELEQKIVELKEELFNLRFQQSMGQLTNTARIREVRKTIAKMKTVITENNLNKEV